MPTLVWRVAATLLLAAVAAAAAGDAPTNATASVLTTASDSYDYLMFVRQWGVTFCESGACAIKPVERFSIHGLWPERNDHSWPQCCDSRYPFHIELIYRLLADLKRVWFSYTRGIKGQCPWHQGAPLSGGNSSDDDAAATPRALLEQPLSLQQDQQQLQAREQAHGDPATPGNGDSPNYSFWRHEWEKHGTCALDVFTNEGAYFGAVLRLQRKHNLDDILFDAGIVPSSKAYRTADVMAAVRDATGYRPELSCRGAALSELTLCVSKRLELMDCPAPRQAAAQNWACKDEMYLPRAPQ